MSKIPKFVEENQDKNGYVHVNDYNKLRGKYENKLKENKKLRECIDNIMQSYESIKDNKKSVEEMFSVMKEFIKNNKNILKPKEEFSTSTSSYEYIVLENNNNLKTSTKSCSSTINNLQTNQILKINSSQVANNTHLSKKFEEIENSYYELIKNFDNLVMKYKLIKEEKNKVDDHNIILLDQIGSLTNEYNNILAELNDCNVTIERFKEIDKCILDSAINSLFLNSNEKKKIIVKDDNNNKIVNNPYILCEPVPTFVKFINKYTK